MPRFPRDTNLLPQPGTKAGETLADTGGKDLLVGRAGNDILDGGNSNDFIMGGRGNDVLTGGSGGDVLLGGRDDDSLDGGKGADLLDGDFGTDTLTGGDQADTFEFHSRTAGFADKFGTLAHDTITDFGNGNDEINLVDFAAGTSFVAVQNAVNNVLLYIDYDGDGGQDLLIADIFGDDGSLVVGDVTSAINFITI